MKTFHVGYDRVARIAHVSETLSNIPGSVTALGNFMLPEDTEDEFGYEQNSRTIYHGVRDKLYHVGVQNMQAVQIVQI